MTDITKEPDGDTTFGSERSDTGTGPDGNQTRVALATQTDCGTNTTGTVGPLGLADCEDPAAAATTCVTRGLTPATDGLAALVRFMEALTDRRVLCDAAPFDHPQLFVLNGHKNADRNKDGKADDISLPAAGGGRCGIRDDVGLLHTERGRPVRAGHAGAVRRREGATVSEA